MHKDVASSLGRRDGHLFMGVPHEIRALVYFPRPYPDYDHLCLEVIYAEMHLSAERVDTPPTREFENVEDASSHVEASAPHQPEAVGDNDARIGSEEEDPTENQEVPPPPAVPAQPTAPAVPAAQAGQPVIRQEPLYERFRRMKPPEFEGSTNPLEAEEWLTSLQIVLNFMNLTDQEKVFCASYVMKKDARYWWEIVQMRRNVLEMSWNDFIQEFNDKFYNRMAMKAQQNEFNNIKQGTMSIMRMSASSTN
ncbi:hypothetical protein TIFTF001_045687 [Ficus carica]|uniref:Ty3 transposon capsid-like protein domain-containing protein n=1 Tax=Ficus carica TaxID=3494 RepID=A0AA87YTL6_FICCA|nr:hypothetical protein TIFTF001_045685 [Ficus carica]GMN22672.1 hypothetical protein TIFTF001_045687 [Ficus carica]